MKKQTISILAIVGCICMLQSCGVTPCTTMTANLSPVYSRIVGQSDSWGGAFGFQGGVEALIPLNCKLPFTYWGGFNISMQGASWEENWGEGDISGTTRTWYMNFPLTARYPFGNGFYGEFGLQPGFLLSAKDNYDGESWDFKEYMKTFDLGIPLGIGYDFPNNFGLGFRIVPGVLNVNAGEYGDEYKDRNLTFVFRLNYTLPGKSK